MMDTLQSGQWKRAGDTGICCLFNAMELNPAGLTASSMALRSAQHAPKASVFLGEEKVGVVTGLQYAFRTDSLLAFVHLSSALPSPDLHLALPVLAARGVTCARCGKTFQKPYEEPCACLRQMPALLFSEILLEGVLFLANAHEDKAIQEERDAYLRRQFVSIIDALQLMSPV